MGSLSRKLHKKLGVKPRHVYPNKHIGSSLRSLFVELGEEEEVDRLTTLKVVRDETALFLSEMRKTHHRDEYARVERAFIDSVGKKYGFPEGWYDGV